jgi:hypothetical protein
MDNEKFKLGEWYNTKTLFEKFINSYYDGGTKLQQRGFTNWIKLYAKCANLTYNHSSSGGICQFSFLYTNQETT